MSAPKQQAGARPGVSHPGKHVQGIERAGCGPTAAPPQGTTDHPTILFEQPGPLRPHPVGIEVLSDLSGGRAADTRVARKVDEGVDIPWCCSPGRHAVHTQRTSKAPRSVRPTTGRRSSPAGWTYSQPGPPARRHAGPAVDGPGRRREPEVLTGGIHEAAEPDAAVGPRIGARAAGELAGSDQEVVAQVGPAAVGEGDVRAGRALVDEGVVDDPERAARVGQALGAVGDERGVLRPRALDDDVAGDERQPAVGQVDRVARGGVAVADAVGDDRVAGRAGLELVAGVGPREPAAGDRQRADGADVEVVRVAVAVAVAEEPRPLDDDVALGVGAGEDAVLVVVEPAARDGEVGALLADARAVAVGHGRAAQLDPVDGRAVAGDHPDRLALGVLAVGPQVRPAAVPAQGEVVLGPGRDVAGVGARVDQHRVAVAGHRRGRAGGRQLAVGPDAPRARTRVGVRRRGGRRGEQAGGEGEDERCRGAHVSPRRPRPAGRP